MSTAMNSRSENINFEDTWNNLQKIVNAIFAPSNFSISRKIWNDGLWDVYKLEPFIDKLSLVTKNFLEEHVNRLFHHLSSLDRDNILQNYYEEWIRYSDSISNLRKLYSYLEKLGIDIGKLGLEIWKKNLIEPLQSSLLCRILECINEDRMGNGHLLNSEVIKAVTESFVTVDGDNMVLYKSLLEEPLVTASAEYFRLQAENWFQNYSISEYMKRVISLLQEESMRCQRFLHSHVEIIMSAKYEMVDHYAINLIQEAKSIISQDRQQDMANMYTLLCYIRSHVMLYADEFEDHIVNEVLRRVNEIGGDNFTFVVEAYKKYKQIIETIFQSDISFTEALDKAYIYIVNHLTENQSYKSSKLLAKYCDQLLKKSSKGLTEMEVDEKLSDAIIIFKYLDDKDMFQKFYSRMLAKRLIHQNSQSMDAEESVINKLKTACGYKVTNILHRMVTDMKISQDLFKKFDSNLSKSHIALPLNFHVRVLQDGSWPFRAAVTSFTIPQEFTKCVQTFEKFYNCHYNGRRRLTWLHHLSQGEVKLCYLSREYLITMKTFQMAILLLFETSASLQCSEIQATLQLNWKDFFENCVGLVKCEILTSNQKELNPETILSLNEKYYNTCNSKNLLVI